MKKRILTVFSAMLFAVCLLFVACADKEDGNVIPGTTEGTETTQTSVAEHQETNTVMTEVTTVTEEPTEEPTRDAAVESTAASTEQTENSDDQFTEEPTEEPTVGSTESPDLGEGGLPIM